MHETSPEPPNGFEIVEADSFAKSIERLGIDYQVFDEILAEKTFAIGRNPYIYPQVPGRNLYRIKIRKSPKWPALRIWFEIEDQKVILLEIDNDWEG